MKDELVSFETAKLAKEKGFDISTSIVNLTVGTGEVISIPTQSLLQRWLREVHNYNIQIESENGVWCYIVKTLPSKQDRDFADSKVCEDGDLWLRSEIMNLDWYSQEYMSYECALEAGLQYTLKIII